MAEEHVVEVERHSPAWLGPAVIVLGIIALAGLGVGWTAYSHDQDTHQTLSADLKSFRQGSAHDSEILAQRLARAEEINNQLQSDLGVVTKRLRVTQGELKHAREEAAQIREENAKQLADMGTEVKGELAAKASAEEMKVVNGQVTGVRTDLDATRKDLQMARTQLGTLIARNHEEVDQLRRLGERDYIEFTVEGKNKPQKVGNVTVELRGTNPKKNQFTLAMVVSDQRVERKNRLINEPIFFYTRGLKQPLELVVNQVSKDKVTGYLSVPKMAQGTTSGSGQ